MDCIARAKQGTSLGLSILLILTIGPGDVTGMAYQSTTSSYPGQGVPATADELQSVVAPIALYPDSLVAQILSAATFPDQVANADYRLQQNKTLTGSALMTAVNNQTWDPSVKALTQFPSVLHNMAQNLAWTSQLGEDYHNQQADVMTAIQTLRAKAKAAGNLNSGPQIAPDSRLATFVELRDLANKKGLALDTNQHSKTAIALAQITAAHRQ